MPPCTCTAHGPSAPALPQRAGQRAPRPADESCQPRTPPDLRQQRHEDGHQDPEAYFAAGLPRAAARPHRPCRARRAGAASNESRELVTAGCCKILTTRKHGEGAGRGICGSPGLGAAAGERSAGDACRERAECVCVGACASVRLSVRACGEGSERASRSGPRPDREAAGRTGRSVHALLLPRPRARTA